MKKSLLFIFICFISISVFGQASWTPPSGTNFTWVYTMDASKSSQTAGTVFPVPPANNPTFSISTTTPLPLRSGFMPAPPSGSVKVAANANLGQTFKLIDVAGTDDKLEMHASSGSNIGKLSIYNIQEATPLTATYFTLNFENNLATNTDWVLLLGKNTVGGTDSKLVNGQGVGTTSTLDTAFFACMKFSISTTDASKMTLSYAGTEGYKNLTDLLDRGTDYSFEILSNNTSVAQNYTRGTNTYTVPSGAYQIWINDARLAVSSGNYDFPANGITRGDNLNAMAINGNNSKTSGVASNDGSAVFSKLTMQFSMSTLPVSLLNFTGSSNLGKVNLGWQTATETNNNYFEVLRFSTDDLTPVKIATVNGRGNSNTLSSYSVFDEKPLSGVNYYQLRQVDFDGISSLSKVISINTGFSADNFIVYPNSSNQLQANVNSATNTFASFSLTNVQGSLLRQFDHPLQKGNNMIQLYSGALSRGVYVARLTIGGNQLSKKVIVQ
nr:T9SS type A sorting domain-containing protein [uncultured Pedobacter sp.]